MERSTTFTHYYPQSGFPFKTDHPLSRASQYTLLNLFSTGSCRGYDHMVVGFTTTGVKSVPITTMFVSSNPTQARCT
jgi:hypothetical protein